MSHCWVCVPNHYNSFPSFIQKSLNGIQHVWEGNGDIALDGKRLLDALPSYQVSLIGYSYGGLVAWWVCVHAPERIKRLVILGSIFERSHIPKRLRFLGHVVPPSMMTWWRTRAVLSRLYSVCSDIPTRPPIVHTLWLLGKKDPFHDWTHYSFPEWEHVNFLLHEGGAYPTEQEWLRFQKFS